METKDIRESVAVPAGQVLYTNDEPIKELYIVVNGSFAIMYGKLKLTAGRGDVLGISDLVDGTHCGTCVALSDSNVLQVPVTGTASLELWIRDNPEYGFSFLGAAFRRIRALLSTYEQCELTCNTLYTDCIQDYKDYQAECEHHGVEAKRLPLIDELSLPDDREPLDLWSPNYYSDFSDFLSQGQESTFATHPGVIAGLIGYACKDYALLRSSYDEARAYQDEVLELYMNSDGDTDDLFDAFTSLYIKIGMNAEQSASIYMSVMRIAKLIGSYNHTTAEILSGRIASFKQSLADAWPSTAPGAAPESDTGSPAPAKKPVVSGPTDEELMKLLAQSQAAIVEYSGLGAEFADAFKKVIDRYATMDDSSAEDDARRVRQSVTTQFLQLYKAVFYRAAKAPGGPKDHDTPLAVYMFLYFGYVDEGLAGTGNALTLARLALKLRDLASGALGHVYPLYDWLLAVLHGDKEPSRSEFDEDYSDLVRIRRSKNEITVAQERVMLADTGAKLEFELSNMIPSILKMTYGRISTYCPVFTEGGVLKSLDDCFLTTSKIDEALDAILSVDFSAYYREYLYSNTTAGIPKEMFHVEVTPDFILTPVIGTRAVMWQEIEGKRRTSPARMALPIFFLEDLKVAMARVTAEFRWEMCKRVQGARWNDLSEPSLTAEYCDFYQFYRRNRELSQEAKDKLKLGLQKARGSYKEMFVQDYTPYVLYEGAGSPRLVRPVREVIFKYCPFSEEIRKNLSGHPMFKDMLDRYNVKLGQALHKIDLLKRRIEATGNKVPEDLLKEEQFIKA